MEKSNKPKLPLRELYRAILSLETFDDCERFFADLCTPAELSAMSDRWKVVKYVDRKVPYREIQEKTGVSTATITRVARSLQYGAGGYRLALNRIDP